MSLHPAKIVNADYDDAGVRIPPSSRLPFAGPGYVGHNADIWGAHTPATLFAPTTTYTTTDEDSNQIISNLHITGKLYVNHSNVTFRDCNISGVIIIHEDARNTRFEWCTILKESGHISDYAAELSAQGYTGPVQPSTHSSTEKLARDVTVGYGTSDRGMRFFRCEMGGYIDLIFIDAYSPRGDVLIQECWMHTMFQMSSDPRQPLKIPATSLPNVIRIVNGNNIRIMRNKIDGWVFRDPSTVSFSTQYGYEQSQTAQGFVTCIQENGIIENVTIDGNIIDGKYEYIFTFLSGETPTTTTGSGTRGSLIKVAQAGFFKLSAIGQNVKIGNNATVLIDTVSTDGKEATTLTPHGGVSGQTVTITFVGPRKVYVTNNVIKKRGSIVHYGTKGNWNIDSSITDQITWYGNRDADTNEVISGQSRMINENNLHWDGTPVT